MSEHTPGPWRNDYSPSTGMGSGYGKSQIIDSKGFPLAGVAITEPQYENGGFTQATLDRLEATAHLIAAAPDLLEACKTAIALLDDARLVMDSDREESLDEHLPSIRDAIRKAEPVAADTDIEG